MCFLKYTITTYKIIYYKVTIKPKFTTYPVSQSRNCIGNSQNDHCAAKLEADKRHNSPPQCHTEAGEFYDGRLGRNMYVGQKNVLGKILRVAFSNVLENDLGIN